MTARSIERFSQHSIISMHLSLTHISNFPTVLFDCPLTPTPFPLTQITYHSNKPANELEVHKMIRIDR